MGVSGTKHLPDDSFSAGDFDGGGGGNSHHTATSSTALCSDQMPASAVSPATPALRSHDVNAAVVGGSMASGDAVLSVTCPCGSIHRTQGEHDWQERSTCTASPARVCCDGAPSSPASSLSPSSSCSSSTSSTSTSSSALPAASCEEVRQLQADWCALRQAMRRFYWFHLGPHTLATNSPSTSPTPPTLTSSSTALGECSKTDVAELPVVQQLHPVVHERVVRLFQRDPHQLFGRLYDQLLHMVAEIRAHLLRQLLAPPSTTPSPTSSPPPDSHQSVPHSQQQCEVFVGALVRHYERLVAAANGMAPALHALQHGYLNRFGVSWQALNDYAYHAGVYMDPAVQTHLPSMLAALHLNADASPPTPATANAAGASTDLAQRYCAFAAQMSSLAHLWTSAGTRLHEISRREAARRTSNCSAIDEVSDGAATASQADVCPSTPPAPSLQQSSAPDAAANNALAKTAVSTASSATAAATHTESVRCSSRKCCSKKQPFSSSNAADAASVVGVAATSTATQQPPAAGASEADALAPPTTDVVAACAMDAASDQHNSCGKATPTADAVMPADGPHAESTCSGQTSAASSQQQPHCCCCCCELFGHGAVNQAPVSRNYPEIRDRLRMRLDQRRRHDPTAGGGGGSGSSTERAPARDERDLGDLLHYIETSSSNSFSAAAGGTTGGQRNEKRAAKRERQRLHKLEQRLTEECQLNQMRSIEDFQRRNPEVTITVVNSAATTAVDASPPPPTPPNSSVTDKTPEQAARVQTNGPSKAATTAPSAPVTSSTRSSLLDTLSSSELAQNETSAADTRMVTIRRVMEPGGGGEPRVTITLNGESPEQDRVLMTLVNGQMCGTGQASGGAGAAANHSTSVDPDKCITKTAKKKLKKALKLQKLKEEEEAAERAREEALRVAEEERRQRELEEQRRQERQQNKKNKKKKKNGIGQVSDGSKTVSTAGSRDVPLKMSSSTARVAENGIKLVTGPRTAATADKTTYRAMNGRVNCDSHTNKPHPQSNGIRRQAKTQQTPAGRCDVGVQSGTIEPPTQLMQDLTLSSDSEIEEIARTYRIPVGISITRVSCATSSRVPHVPSSMSVAAATSPSTSIAPTATGKSSCNGSITVAKSTEMVNEATAGRLKDASCGGDGGVAARTDDKKAARKKRRKKKTQAVGEEVHQLTPNVTISKVDGGGRCSRSVDDIESVFMPSVGGVTDSVDQEVEAFKRFCLDSPQVNREHRPKVNLNIKDIFIKMKPS